MTTVRNNIFIRTNDRKKTELYLPLKSASEKCSLCMYKYMYIGTCMYLHKCFRVDGKLHARIPNLYVTIAQETVNHTQLARELQVKSACTCTLYVAMYVHVLNRCIHM